MANENARFKLALYSGLGLVVMAAMLLAVNAVVRVMNVRVDFTQEKQFTLSPGTKAILQKLDTPVTLRYYFSRDVAEMPVHMRNYAVRVEDLLKEYRAVGGKKIVMQTFNPTPDSDAEDSANLDGVTGQALSLGGSTVYLGLAVNCLDKTVALPYLAPERETLLEYDVTRAITQVLNAEKPVLGVMSSLPVMGMPFNPMMMQMRQKPPPAWMIITELKKDYTVKEVPLETEEIPAEIRTLILIHPKGISDRALYAIDQYLMRGGKLLAFLEPMSFVEMQQNQQPQMQMQPPGASTLGKLFDAWGVTFETEKIVADIELMTRVGGGPDGQPQSLPAVLSLTSANVDKGDPATGELERLMMGWCGSFSGNAADGLTKSVLLQTSEKSKLVEKFMAQMPGDAMLRDFKADGTRKQLAIKLTGKFKTAFPDGKPEAEKKDDGEKKPEEAAKDQPKEQGLMQSEKATMVVLVGDSDMVYDHFCVQVQNFMGQQFAVPFNDNFTFVQNLIEQLSGDQNLISIRSRGKITRPFDKVGKMQAEAEQRFQDKIRQLEDELSEAQRKIGELQREKKADQKYVLSKEQKDAIAKFKQKEAETRKELKQVRKQLRQDVDSLAAWLKFYNIALIPIFVGITGVSVAVFKKRRIKSA